ncbi:MAG: hypothetical protein JWR69_2462 [Pedosphaera sp.]|nr:hypothetical protein [Pedosphaera sp.]
MKANEPFRIIEFINPRTQAISFRVTGMLAGKQIRKNRKTLAEATTLKQDYERQALNLVPLPTITTRLTADQAAEAESCYRALVGKKFTLTQALEFAIRNWTETEKRITVADGIVAFLKTKTDANKRAATVRNLKSRLNLLKNSFADRLVSELQPDAVKPLIHREGSGLVNRNGDYLAFTNFFNWARTEGYCQISPMDRIDKIQVDEDGEPAVLPLDRVRRLVAAAEDYKGGILVPYVTVCLFCGIRPDREASRLNWNLIKVESKIIKIGADVAKMRGRRVVEIPDNAVEFLAPHALEKTPIKGKNWRKDFEAVKRLAGFGSVDKKHKQPTKRHPVVGPCYCKECCKTKGITLEAWPQDVMRHTAISYHLALNKDEDKTATWAGNSPEICHKKYKALIEDKAHVADFWNIRPGESKIIDLKKAAAA